MCLLCLGVETQCVYCVQVLRHGYFASCENSTNIRRLSATSRRVLNVASPQTLAPVANVSELPISTVPAVEPVTRQDTSYLFPWLNEDQPDQSKRTSPAPPTQSASSTVSHKPPPPSFLNSLHVSLSSAMSAVSTIIFLIVKLSIDLNSVIKKRKCVPGPHTQISRSGYSLT